MSDSTETAILDHTCLAALYRADEFFTGLYIEASHQRGRILIPSLCVWAADRATPGTARHAASLRHAEHVAFTTAHAVEASAWAGTEAAVAHAAAIAWQAATAGDSYTVLSLSPELYRSTAVRPLNPYED
ncbi:hypothetical protein ACIRU8_15980 [Streptomyces sp. NPDC101175]|uniref:hypothetical protein n=1 Tax=Streptomyces sp. NPDC101175 TaxID=3366123 RepID=UPI0038341454